MKYFKHTGTIEICHPRLPDLMLYIFASGFLLRNKVYQNRLESSPLCIPLIQFPPPLSYSCYYPFNMCIFISNIKYSLRNFDIYICGFTLQVSWNILFPINMF